MHVNAVSLKATVQPVAQRVYGTLFGAVDANNEYGAKVREFLGNLGVEHDVAIKRMDDVRNAVKMVFNTNKATVVTLGGIWLNEAKLAKMSDAELTYALAYAAAEYVHIGAMSTALRIGAVTMPYAALAALNYFAFLRTDYTQWPAKPANGGTIMHWMRSMAHAAKVVAMPAINYLGVTTFHNSFARPLAAIVGRDAEEKIVNETADMLVKNGYDWVIRDYVDQLNQCSVNGTCADALEDKLLSAKDLAGRLSTFIIKA